ncbi:MAG: hypothetical protein GY762_12995 [Proteobacteria bacterium]|nr:hypothetical protein [Pseudomonadota bacterium]
MIIKCPQCSARYKIPDSSIGANPRKLRCAKCEKAFIVARRVTIPPGGFDDFEYEELTQRESSSLPEEFAFLTRTSLAPPEGPPAPPVPKEPSQDPLVPDREPQGEPTIPTEMDFEKPAVSVDESVPVSVEDSPAAMQEAPRQSLAPEWEEEDPFDLTGFHVEQQNERSKKIGKAITIVIAVVALFFVFVAYRNSWSLSMPKLGKQIGFAFSAGEREYIPEEARGLEAFVDSRQTILGPEKRAFLAIVGGVINNDVATRSHILLRGRLYDASGDLRKEAKAPCGHTLTEKKIKATAGGKMEEHYQKGGKLINCAIKSNSSGAFQIVFDDLPSDYDSSFKTEVRAIYAE